MAKREAVLKFRFDAQGGIAGIDRLDDKLDQVGRTADQQGQKVSRLGSTFKTAIGVAAVAGVVALTAALGRLARNGLRLVENAYRARGIQEIAEGRLSKALENLGGGAELATGKLIEQAAALQSLTNFGDEEIITAMSMLATFKELAGPEGLQLLTPRVLDLAAGSGKATGETMDLNTAALVLGKSLTQGSGALSRYGISMSDAEKAAFDAAAGLEKVSILATVIDNNFGGMAETVVDPVKQLQNAAGDLLEVIGEGLRPELKELAEEMTAMAQSGDTVELARQFGEELGEAIRGVFEFVAEHKDDFIRFLEATGNLLDTIGEASDKVGTLLGGSGENTFFGIPLPTLAGTIAEIEALNNGLERFFGLTGSGKSGSGIAPIPSHFQPGSIDLDGTFKPLASHDPPPAPSGSGSGSGSGGGPGPAPQRPSTAFEPTSIADMLDDPTRLGNNLSAQLGLEEDLPVILGALRTLGDGAEEMADRWEDAGNRIREAEDQKRQALEQTLAAQLGAVDTSIRSTDDIVNATLSGVRAIIQAKLAEAIARNLAAAGPAAVFAAPFIAASLNAVFNRLLPPGLGGVSAGSGGGSSFDPSAYTGGGRGFASSSYGGLSGGFAGRGIPSGRSSAQETAVLAAEIRSVGDAILGKQWGITGANLQTVNTRANRLQRRAGNIR